MIIRSILLILTGQGGRKVSRDFEIENGILEKYHGLDEHIVIPDGVTEIGHDAFRRCYTVTSVTIPESVSIIGESAFEFCTNLASITIPDSVTEIKSRAFYECTGLTSVVILGSVTQIDDDTFEDCTGLLSVTLPDSITRIGTSAFNHCKNLASITIPNSVAEIAHGAFRDCTSLTSVTIPDSVTTMKDNAFADCSSLTSVRISNSLTEISYSTFANCKSLKSVVIPQSVTKIENRVFENCTGLTSIDIPDTVREIGRWAFRGCEGLADSGGFVIVRGVLYSYHGKSGEAVIPDSVTMIGRNAFEGCTGLTSVIIPNSVTIIEDSAFRGCTGLTSVTIPDSVKSLGLHNQMGKTFCDCINLTSIIIPASVEQIEVNSFRGCQQLTVVCPEGSYTHRYCERNQLTFIFDYQYEAFHGVLPQGYEKLASPFLADEEQPYIFISYSHKDRDTVLRKIKILYESGWRVWYDEGLTIGDKYDETLETHVRNCAAFLLFVTENSLKSMYVRENEVPWAIGYGKPIIKCLLDEKLNYEIEEGSVIATVLPSAVEGALNKIRGLKKRGEPQGKRHFGRRQSRGPGCPRRERLCILPVR